MDFAEGIWREVRYNPLGSRGLGGALRAKASPGNGLGGSESKEGMFLLVVQSCTQAV